MANRVSVFFQARDTLGKILKPTITNHLPTVKHKKRKLGSNRNGFFRKIRCPKGSPENSRNGSSIVNYILAILTASISLGKYLWKCQKGPQTISSGLQSHPCVKPSPSVTALAQALSLASQACLSLSSFSNRILTG